MKKTVLIAAEGFEEVEGLTVVDLLRRAGIECQIVSLSGTETITGSHGIRISADAKFSETDFASLDGIILPGGMPGTKNLLDDTRVAEQLRTMCNAGELVAAVCAAPTVLGKAGLLLGKHATCYPGMENDLTGADYCTASVVRDGNLITSRGLGTAIPFALALVEYLEGSDAAELLSKRIVFS